MHACMMTVVWCRESEGQTREWSNIFVLEGQLKEPILTTNKTYSKDATDPQISKYAHTETKGILIFGTELCPWDLDSL